MAYDTSLMSHILAVNECLQKFNARAELDPETFNLKIRAHGKYVELQPQFVFDNDGSIAFSPKLLPKALDFCGWRAYFNRVWPLAIDKLAFKDFCEQNGLRTPRRWSTASKVDANVIIKRSRSSFAQGISGPFTSAMVRSGTYSLLAGDFFEEFIEGTVIKIWYWNATPVCLDMRAMPSVTGDGKRTLRELIMKASLQFIPTDWQVRDSVARFQGVSLESVIADGKSVMIDFLYSSAFHPISVYFGNQNVLEKFAGTPLLQGLQDAGRQFLAAIPDTFRQGTVYSIDAIVDKNELVWFLEMNCNPIVHPDTYPLMFESMFKSAA